VQYRINFRARHSEESYNLKKVTKVKSVNVLTF
jgi:hypothetical protein